MSEITKAEIRKKLGNITQLQELLFGDKIDEYNSKLEQHARRLNILESNLQKSQVAIKESIVQLENKLLEHIVSVASSLEKNSQDKILKTQEQQHKLEQKLNKIAKYSQEHLDFLHQSLNTKTNSLQSEIIQTKSALNQDLNLVKQELLAKLESNLEELNINKISPTDLADVLFELSLKLKRTDADSNLSQPEELKTYQTKMLPETKEN